MSENQWAYQEIPIEWKMPGEVQLQMNNGLNELKEGKPNLAIVSFSEAVKLDKTLWVAYYYRGIAYRLLGFHYASLNDFQTVINLQPNQTESYIELGRIYRADNRIKDAEDYFLKAQASSPDKPYATLLLGNLEILKNNQEEARKKYLQCLTIDPNYLEAKVKLGVLSILIEKRSSAGLPYFNEVLEIDSTHQSALFLRAMLNFQDNQKSSLKDLNTFIKHNPTNIFIKQYRAVLLTNLGDFEKAFSDFQVVIQSTFQTEDLQTSGDFKIDMQYALYYTLRSIYGLPESDLLLVKKAFCFYLTGGFKNGINSLKKVKDYKNSSLCLFLLGLGTEYSIPLSQSDALAQATKYYDQAISLDNDIRDAHKKAAMSYVDRRNWKKSEFHFAQTLRIDPEHLIVYQLRGKSRYDREDYQAAIVDYTHYLEKDTLNSSVYKDRAYAYTAIGDLNHAAEDLIACHYDFDRFKELPDMMIKKGDTIQALHYINGFIKQNSERKALIYKIELLIMLKKWDEAAALNEKVLTSLPEGASQDHFAYLLVTKGRIYSHFNNRAVAEPAFDKAINEYGGYAYAYLERGRFYLTQGEKKLAKIDLQIALGKGAIEARELLKKL